MTAKAVRYWYYQPVEFSGRCDSNADVRFKGTQKCVWDSSLMALMSSSASANRFDRPFFVRGK